MNNTEQSTFSKYYNSNFSPEILEKSSEDHNNIINVSPHYSSSLRVIRVHYMGEFSRKYYNKTEYFTQKTLRLFPRTE